MVCPGDDILAIISSVLLGINQDQGKELALPENQIGEFLKNLREKYKFKSVKPSLF